MAEKMNSLESLINDRFDSMVRELDKVEQGFVRQLAELSRSTEQRFEQVNQYKEATRKMLAEQAASIENRLRIVENQIANWQGRLLVIGGVWGIVAILISVLLNYFIRTATKL